EIQLAVVRIHRRFQRTDCVKALNQLVTARTFGRQINEANAGSIGALKVFALMADLRLTRIGASAIRRGSHAHQAIAGLIWISKQRHAVDGPGCSRDSWPAGRGTNDPAMSKHLFVVGIGEVVKHLWRGWLLNPSSLYGPGWLQMDDAFLRCVRRKAVGRKRRTGPSN